MAAIWCSKDRTGAYVKAIKGEVPSGAAAPACMNLVARQFALGESLEVQGSGVRGRPGPSACGTNEQNVT